MPNGTHINNVFAARIHKSNAQDVVSECTDSERWQRTKLLVLAASTPCMVGEAGEAMPWHEYVMSEVDGLVDELVDNAIRQFLAQYIVDYPEDCMDELETNEGGGE